MGKPGGSHVPSSMNESIVHEKGTRGTETSKYPEEKKTKVIAQVVASERARAQTGGVTASSGVEGPSTKIHGNVSRIVWKDKP